MNISKILVAVFDLILFAAAAVAQGACSTLN
jgi:hypothetical protein